MPRLDDGSRIKEKRNPSSFKITDAKDFSRGQQSKQSGILKNNISEPSPLV